MYIDGSVRVTHYNSLCRISKIENQACPIITVALIEREVDSIASILALANKMVTNDGVLLCTIYIVRYPYDTTS